MDEIPPKVEAVYREAVSAVERQERVLDDLRNRSFTLLAGASVLVGVLGLGEPAEDWPFWAALATFFGVAVSTGWVQRSMKWYSNPSFNYVSSHVDDPAIDDRAVFRDLAIHHQQNWSRNNAQLKRVHFALSLSVVLLAMTVLFLLLGKLREPDPATITNEGALAAVLRLQISRWQPF